MTFEEGVQKFIDNNCYLSNGAGQLSKKWDLPEDLIREAKLEARKRIKGGMENPTPIKGKLKSKWFNGKTWCESYDYTEEEIDTTDFEAILTKVFKEKGEQLELPEVTNSGYNLNIYLTDQHIGASVENSLYSNHFDASVYKDRMNQVFKWIVDKYKLYGGFEVITIFFLGDTFDGQDGFTVKRTHDLPQNMSNEQAFEIGLRVNKLFLERLFQSKFASKFNVRFVRESNHGGSMDYYLFKALETWIKDTYVVNCKIADSFIDVITIAGRSFIYSHGKDNKDMKTGLPLNLNDKTEVFLNQYIYANNIKGKISVVKADLHQSNYNESKLFSYRNVPSLFGSSKWIMSNFGKTEPGVGWDLFNEDEIFGGVIKFK